MLIRAIRRVDITLIIYRCVGGHGKVCRLQMQESRLRQNDMQALGHALTAIGCVEARFEF